VPARKGWPRHSITALCGSSRQRDTELNKTAIVVLLAGFSAVLMLPSFAWSCSCDGRRSVSDELKAAAAVFLGEVVVIDPDPEKGKAWFTSDTVTFQVEAGWKGVSTRHIRVVTGDDEGACGFPFVKGETYLVYAFSCPDCAGGLSTHLCTRTKLGGRWDRIWLGKPKWKADAEDK